MLNKTWTITRNQPQQQQRWPLRNGRTHTGRSRKSDGGPAARDTFTAVSTLESAPRLQPVSRKLMATVTRAWRLCPRGQGGQGTVVGFVRPHLTPTGQGTFKHVGRLQGPAGSWSPHRAPAPRGSRQQPDRQAGFASAAQEVRKFLEQQSWAAEPVGPGRTCAASWALGTRSGWPLLPPHTCLNLRRLLGHEVWFSEGWF